MLLVRSSLWFVGLGILACGGKTNDPGHLTPVGSGGGGSGSGGSDPGPTGTGGSAAECESFDDEVGDSVSIVLVNQTSESIFVGPFTEGSCGSNPPPFSIEHAGQAVPHFIDSCSGGTCEQLRDVGYLGCPDICWPSETIELAPGEEYIIDWGGLILTQRTLPVDCVTTEDGPESDEQCFQRTEIATGPYTFRAGVGTELFCETWAEPCGSCTPNDSGGCVHTNSYVGGEMLQAETEVEIDQRGLGANDPIEIVFRD